MPIHGIDVSHHQGVIDWRRVRADGIAYTIIKASEGVTFTDPQFSRNWRDANAAGLLRGAYHFLHPGRGAAQAQHFLRVVGNPAGALLVVDAETTASGGKPGKADAAAFVAEVRRQLGPNRPVGIYTGRWYWHGTIGDPALTDLRVWLWESRYVSGSGAWRTLAAKVDNGWHNQIRAGGLRPTLIQFSSSGSVAGVAGRVDLDTYPGTLDQLRPLTGQGTPPARPAPPARPTPRPPAIRYEPYRHGQKPGSRTIRQGNAGDDVRFVQRYIDITADGYFGPQTHARVRWYQGMRRIGVDGIVGPKTWAQMGIR